VRQFSSISMQKNIRRSYRVVVTVNASPRRNKTVMTDTNAVCNLFVVLIDRECITRRQPDRSGKQIVLSGGSRITLMANTSKSFVGMC
jgi:hypothetical protein